LVPTPPTSTLFPYTTLFRSKLNRLGLRSVEDILFHLPLRYQDRTRVTPIGALRPGLDAVIEGMVVAADVVMGRRRSLLCRIQDRSEEHTSELQSRENLVCRL